MISAIALFSPCTIVANKEIRNSVKKVMKSRNNFQVFYHVITFSTLNFNMILRRGFNVNEFCDSTPGPQLSPNDM